MSDAGISLWYATEECLRYGAKGTAASSAPEAILFMEFVPLISVCPEAPATVVLST